MICLSISRSTEIEKGRIGGTGGREKGERRAGLGEGEEERRGEEGKRGGEKLEETRRGFSLSENNLNLAKDINIHIHTVFL